MKIRSPGGAVISWRIAFFGGIPNGTPWPNVPLALSQSTFDGFVSTDESCTTAKLWETGVRNFYADHQYSGRYIPMISGTFWDELSADQQTLMRDLWAQNIGTYRTNAAYWAAITDSQTLGTALGDWMADTTRLGYAGGAFVFAAALLVRVVAYYRTNVSHVSLFWAAFILTRALGATLGDFLDKPLKDGGLALSRPLSTVVLCVFILGCILILPQKAGRHPALSQTAS